MSIFTWLLHLTDPNLKAKLAGTYHEGELQATADMSNVDIVEACYRRGWLNRCGYRDAMETAQARDRGNTRRWPG